MLIKVEPKKKALTGRKSVETPERVCFKEFTDKVFVLLDAGPGITHINYWKLKFGF